jgi:Sec-independent protein translocase protein TatA
MVSDALAPGRVLVVLLVARIVLGPTEIPKAVRTVARVRR